MESLIPGGNEYQYFTYPSGEALGINVHMNFSERIIKYPQWYDTGFGYSREWNSEAVSNIVYMIQYGHFNINADTDEILSLLDEWDSEYCMNAPSKFHTR